MLSANVYLKLLCKDYPDKLLLTWKWQNLIKNILKNCHKNEKSSPVIHMLIIHFCIFELERRVSILNLLNSFHKPIFFVTRAFDNKIYNFADFKIFLQGLKVYRKFNNQSIISIVYILIWNTRNSKFTTALTLKVTVKKSL